MIVELQNCSVFFGEHEVLKNITFKIEDRDRIGLIGANGVGKSTLLNTIVGDIIPLIGTRSKSNGKKIGYLRQNALLNADKTINEVLKEEFSNLLKIQKEIESLYNQISEIKDLNSLEYKVLSSKYADLQTQFEHKDGYNIEVKINTVKNGMGFGNFDCERLVSSLSGGEKTRLSICCLLLSEPDLLILDEPTNHLDFHALMWLEEYLRTYNGAILMVSHDRYFLDNTVTQIVELYQGELKKYVGNYSDFIKTKAQNYSTMEKEYEKQQNEIESLKDYVAKNSARASTAKSAKSRQNTLDKMEVLSKPSDYIKTIQLSFQYNVQPIKNVLKVSDLTLRAGKKELSFIDSFEVIRGEKIAIVGDNGVGKSTFLKAILSLSRESTGEIVWGGNVKTSYFEQESDYMHENKTVFDEVHDRFPSLYEQKIRDTLGKMLISADNVYKRISVLSGGEKAKVKFSIMMLMQGNVLILDEPSNHLDLPSKEILDKALSDYEGTIIMVSHDRYLLNKVPTKILEFNSNKKDIDIYEGNYDYYISKKKIQATQDKQESTKVAENKDNSFYRSKKMRAQETKKANDIKKLELKIEETENIISKLQVEMSRNDVAVDFELLSEKCDLLSEKQDELSTLYDAWEIINE